MLRNYLSIALRNIRQNPLYALINMFSLAIGLAACIVIYLFIKDERSFDAFHSKGNVIYRLDEVQNFPGTNLQKVALSMPGMGPHMNADFPEIVNFTRYQGRGKILFKRGETQFLIDHVASVDSTFLKMFDFELIAGDRSTCLDQPNTIVVTEKTARKFFTDPSSALGNTFTLPDKEYKISGVLKDVPENSHLQFDALISLTTITSQDPQFNNASGSNFLNTYFQLQPGVDIKALEAKLPAFMVRYTGEKDINTYYTLFFQSLDQVHLGSTEIEHDYNNYRKFNGSYLDVFYVIGLFILLIASVNFMNLTTARASHRWKELGVRKTVGARKTQLWLQFIFESTMLAVFALVLAFALDVIFIPVLNHLIDRQLSFSALLSHPWHLSAVVLTALILGALTGIYPAFYMTSFNMASILKGGGKKEGKSIFRSALVVVQFGLALSMIVSTLIVVQQLSFMKNANIGFSKDQMMLVDLNKDANDKFEVLKTELLKSRFVLGVTASGQRLGSNFHQWGFKVKADTGIVDITSSNVNVEYDFLKVYDIKIKQGRSFSKEFARDNGMAFVINESLAKALHLKDPVGTPAGHGFYKNDSLGTIIGVVGDFNFNSLHHKINTLAMVVHPTWGYDEMTVKIEGVQATEAIAAVKEIWERVVPTYPFTYDFLSEHFNMLYRSDQQMSSVVTIVATLAILISCMGLFGLAAITTERKIKEIGIRKTLGASVGQILVLLSGNFVKLIFVSFVIASPLTYYLLSKWLQGFAYRIGINPLLFLLGGGAALLIAILTISYHTYRSAHANPVEALRYE